MLNWQRIQAVFEPSTESHGKAAKLIGLSCPAPVFRALFHGAHGNAPIEALVSHVDWAGVEWNLETRTGGSFREVGIDRAFQSAVDEAYASVLAAGVTHERTDVIASWQEKGTWIEPPLLIEGELIGSAVRDLILLGHTRLGCLLALIDQGAVAESARHEIWLARARAR